MLSGDWDLPIGFTHLLFISIGLLFSVFWPPRGLLQMSYGDFHRTSNEGLMYSRQPYLTYLPQCENVGFELCVWTWILQLLSTPGMVVLALMVIDYREHISDLKWIKNMVSCIVYNTKCSLNHPRAPPIQMKVLHNLLTVKLDVTL